MIDAERRDGDAGQKAVDGENRADWAELARFEKINGSWYITGGGLRLQIIH